LKDPTKAKLGSKHRLTLGLKQVTNSVKANHCKFVLLAPDTEGSVELNKKIFQLVQACISKEVPVVYSLSRRQLSKATGANTRQSVVGIVSAEGSFPIFKKLQRWHEAAGGDAMRQVQEVLDKDKDKDKDKDTGKDRKS